MKLSKCKNNEKPVLVILTAFSYQHATIMRELSGEWYFIFSMFMFIIKIHQTFGNKWKQNKKVYLKHF